MVFTQFNLKVMKKVVLVFVVIVLAISVNGQSKFSVKDFGSFKLHTFVSSNPLGDMNYIIEGQNGLVVLEPVSFFDDIKIFDNYLKGLRKPVQKVIADYHLTGFNAYDPSKIVVVEGAPEYMLGERYKGMVSNFAKNFEEKFDSRENKASATVKKNSTENWAGVTFKFMPAIPADEPSTTINIGGKIYYTHFTPSISHFSPMRIRNKESIDSVITELETAKASGCQTFIGGHGTAIADIKAVDFQIAYLKKMKELLSKETTSTDFIAALQQAYPNLDATEGLIRIAETLYK